MTVDSVAPTIDAADIASLSGTTDVGGNFGHVWNNRARQGQTFTTGSNPGGYLLDAITMHVQVNQASTMADLWNIRVGTIAGSTLTPISSETAAGATIPQSTAGNGFPSYVTWTLDTAVALLPNTVYGFDVDTNGQGGGFISLNDDTDPYPDGGRLTQPGVGANFTDLTPGSDRAFHLNLVAANVADMDGDGLPDDWETEHGLDPDDNGDNPNNNGVPGDPDNGPAGDPDMDNVDNLTEFTHGSDPQDADSDDDGFDDGVEIAAGSDPADPADVPSVEQMSVSSSPPAVDGEDIAQLGGEIDIGGDQGHAWSNRPRQGQSFTTGADPAGYTLDTITVRARVNQVSTISDNWELRVGSIDETGVFTPLTTEMITGVAIPNGIENWVTWTLGTPLQLDPDTQYGFDVFPVGPGYISLGESTDVLAGGSAYSAGSPGSMVFPESPPDPITEHGSDRAFHVNLESGGGGGFRITEILMVETLEGPAVRITWQSRLGRHYAVDASTDLGDWDTEVDDNIESGGETTTLEQQIDDLPIVGPRIFFRVRLSE